MSYSPTATLPTPVFLLIQDGIIVDRAMFVQFLCTKKIAEYAGFKIAVGYMHGSKKWIGGVLADVAPLIGQNYWCISSEEYDNVIIEASHFRPSAFVLHSLRDYSAKGRLANPLALPKTLTITAGITARDYELNDVYPTPDPATLAM